MAGFSDDFIERVKESNDIVDLVSEYVNLKRVGKNYKGLCPFHQEKTPSFTVNPHNQFFYCFGCGAGGDIVSFLMEIENITFYECIKQLAGRAGLELPDHSKKSKKVNKKRERIFALNKLTAKFYHYLLVEKEVGKKALTYLRERGFSEVDIDKFYLGYAPDRWRSLYKFLTNKGYKTGELKEAGLISVSRNNSFYDRFRNRIIFPIFNIRNEVIAFGGRLLAEEEVKGPKYLNSPETLIYTKSKNLYGLNWARKSFRRNDRAIIMEGYTDVLTAQKAGLNNTVASLGTSLTSGQAQLLARYVSTVDIAYDSDVAGNKATIRGLDILKDVGLNVNVIELPAAMDPDDYIREKGREKFIELMEDATGLIDYKIKQIIDNQNLKDSSTKISLTKKLIKLLAGIKDDLEREVYLDKIARRLDVSRDLLEKEVKKKRNYKTKETKKKDKNYKNSYTKNTDSSINILESKIIKAFFDYKEYRSLILDKINPDYFSGSNFFLAKKLWNNGQGNIDNIKNSFTDEKLKELFMKYQVQETREVSQEMLNGWLGKLQEKRNFNGKIKIYRELESEYEPSLVNLNKLLVRFQELSVDMGKEG